MLPQACFEVTISLPEDIVNNIINKLGEIKTINNSNLGTDTMNSMSEKNMKINANNLAHNLITEEDNKEESSYTVYRMKVPSNKLTVDPPGLNNF